LKLQTDLHSPEVELQFDIPVEKILKIKIFKVEVKNYKVYYARNFRLALELFTNRPNKLECFSLQTFLA
jgi:hypothetical protein